MGFWDTPPPWGVDPGLPPGYQPPPDPLAAAMLAQRVESPLERSLREFQTNPGAFRSDNAADVPAPETGPYVPYLDRAIGAPVIQSLPGIGRAPASVADMLGGGAAKSVYGVGDDLRRAYTGEMAVDPSNPSPDVMRSAWNAAGFAAGAPAFAKVPLGAGEAVLGSGAIRPSAAGAADVASGMTGDALIAKLSKRFEPQSEHPINEGGQMVSLFLPNGKVVAQNYPSHNQLLQAADINMPLEEFMGKTGAVRAHGPDNYEIHAPLSTSQIRAIREYAKDHGANTVNVDVSTGDGTFKSEMFHLPNEASDLKDFASDAKGWSSSSPFPDPNSASPASGGMLQAAPPSFTAYHGSPHDFDKFDLSKIGTGEGAQAYGHGLYFAENEGVARGYRDKLAGPVLDQGVSTAWVKQAGGDRAAAETAFKDHIGYDRLVERANSGDRGAQVFLNESEDVLAGIRKPHGHMYEARIHADPEHFLDWDKPLSQQSPKVQEAIKRMASKYGVEPDMSIMGADAYHSVASNLADPNITAMNASQRAGAPNATEHFREAGIPGIKYLDQGSRAPGGLNRTQLENSISVLRDDIARLEQTGGGDLPRLQEKLSSFQNALEAMPKETHNYVSFRDDIIEILRKYGLAGLGLAGYGMAQGQQQTHQ